MRNTMDTGDRPGEGTAIRFRMLTLDEVHFRRGEVLKVAFHPLMLLFYAAFVALISLLDTNDTWGIVPERYDAVVYAAGTLAGAAFIILFLRLAEQKGRRGRTVTVRGTPVFLAAALVGLLTSEMVVFAMMGSSEMRLLHAVILVLFYYGLIELTMAFATAYIMPRALRQIRARAPATDEAAARTDTRTRPANLTVVPAGRRVAVLPTRPATSVHVGTARYRVAEVRRVEAEGNYVRVVTAGTRKLLPGPFSRVVAQLPETAGQLVSRSCWVAEGAIVAHRREGRDLFLHLEDGAEVRVAAARRETITDWIRVIEMAGKERAG